MRLFLGDMIISFYYHDFFLAQSIKLMNESIYRIIGHFDLALKYFFVDGSTDQERRGEGKKFIKDGVKRSQHHRVAVWDGVIPEAVEGVGCLLRHRGVLYCVSSQRARRKA